MRIETTGIKETAQTQIQEGGKEQVSFQKGNVIQATVVEQDGENVLLRMQDGKVFSAKLGAIMTLHARDQVECMVGVREDGGMHLQLLSIVPDSLYTRAASKERALLSALGLMRDSNAAALLSAMKEMGLTPSRHLLLSAMQLMRDTPLGAKGAVFFAANQIDASPEAVKAFQTMQQGQTAGAALYEIAQQAAVQEGAVQSAAGNMQAQQATPQERAAQSAAGDIQAQQAAAQGEAAQSAAGDMQAKLADRDMAAQPAQATIEQSITTQSAMEQPPPEQADAAQANRQAPDTAQARGGDVKQTPLGQAQPMEQPLQNAAEQPRPKEEAQVSRAGDEAAQQAAAGQGKNKIDALSRRLLRMFMEIDAQTDGGRVKKATADTARQAKFLEEILQTEQSRGTLASKMTDVAAQTKLTQDVQRFVCVHIPVCHREHDTAELYMYKDKKKKRIDPENTAILIGLVTQNMGRVESLIRVERRNVSLAFKVEAEEAVPLLKERARELYHAFKAHNYTLVDTKVSVLHERTTLENAEEALQAAVSRPEMLVDCKV